MLYTLYVCTKVKIETTHHTCGTPLCAALVVGALLPSRTATHSHSFSCHFIFCIFYCPHILDGIIQTAVRLANLIPTNIQLHFRAQMVPFRTSIRTCFDRGTTGASTSSKSWINATQCRCCFRRHKFGKHVHFKTVRVGL